MEIENISKSQLEVWEWKEKAAESVMALPPGERIRMILKRTSATATTLKRRKRKKPALRAADPGEPRIATSTPKP